MKQSTTFAQVATNFLNVLQGYTKTIRFLLVMFLTLSVSAEVWADYTITFKTSGSGELTTKDAIVNTGGDYVSSVSAAKTYAESAGLRYGSGDKMGYTTFTLSNAGQIKASKIIFQGAKYYSSDNSSLKYTITYTDATTTSGTIALSSTATNKEATLESSKTISKIDIRKTANSNKRFYVQGVKVVSAAVANHTVTFDAGSGSCSTPNFTQTSTTRSVNLPSASTTCEGWTFAGWCTSSADNEDENSTSPGTILLSGDSYTPNSTHTLYAIYTRSESGGTATSYVKVSADNVTTGTYVIAAIRSSSVSSNYYPATGAISSGDMVVSDNTFTLTNETFTEIPDGGIEFTFTGDNTNGFTINNGSGNLGYTSSSSRKLAFGEYNTKWKVYDHDNPQAGVYLQHSDGSSYYTITENSTSTTPIRGYASETKYRSIYLFKKGSASTTYYMTNLTCATETAYSVKLTQPSNGSISATPYENIKEDDIVNLTANPNSGYKLSAWTVVRDDNSQSVTVMNNQFTMPASDVTVSATFVAIPQLKTPTNLSATDITTTAATLTWDWSDNENSQYLNGYNLYYKKVGEANFTGPMTCNSKSSTITGLTPNTEYVFKVAATSNNINECKSSEQSAEYTFKTKDLTPLNAPSNLRETISCDGVSLAWNAVSGASKYEYTLNGTSKQIDKSSTSVYISPVTAGKTYTWKVKAIGDGVNTSDSEYSEERTFTTNYTITYEVDGGEAVEDGCGTALPNPLPTPTKNHYEFDGWYMDNELTTKAVAGAAISQNITLYAKWTADTYKITLNPQDGTLKDKSGNVQPTIVIDYVYGATGAYLTDYYSTVEKSGYQFKGWYNATSGGSKWTTTSSATQDVTLYAQWKKEHTIKWIVNGDTDTPYETTYVVDDDALVLPSNPNAPSTCEDKVFVGWTESATVNADGNGIEYVDEDTKPNTDKTYYAVFASLDGDAAGDYKKVTSELSDWSGEYLIVYEAGNIAFDGGQEQEYLNDGYHISVTIEDDAIAATTEMDNARFTVAKMTGGYSVKSASGYYIGCTSSDKGLYSSHDIQYLNQISWGKPWDSAAEGVIIKSQNNPILLYSTTAGRFRYYSSAQEPISLYRKSSYTDYTTVCVETYNVKYDANGATSGNVPVDENNYILNATVTVLGNTGNLQKTHYSFVGWNTQTDGNGTSYQAGETFTITEDVTLYAIWEEVPQYSVTWYVNGKQLTDIELSGASKTVYEGDRITKTPPAPNPEDFCGQVFAGWTDAEMDVNDTDEPTIYNLVDEFPTASGNQNFYAVFADYEN